MEKRKRARTGVVDDCDVEVAVCPALNTPEEVAACKSQPRAIVKHLITQKTRPHAQCGHLKEQFACVPMRPKPLMATLICLAWVTCFEPVVPCTHRH